MKIRVVSLLLLLALTFTVIFPLTSCGKYEPQKSTAEESKAVMTLSFEGKEYEVAYELYRAFFLELRADIDNGDNTVWTGEDKKSYINRIDELILERICEIYSVFHLCDKVGINPYSNKINTLIEDYIELAVDEDYDGDYPAYLADLKAMNLNYSVQELLIRYSLSLENLNAYYVGNLDSDIPEPGALEYTREDVRNFYFNTNEARRMLRVFLSKDAFTAKRAEQIREGIAARHSAESVTNYIIQFSTSGATDIKNGEIIGQYTLDKFYYSEITDSLFSLEIGEAGDVIHINSDTLEGYTIVYRIDVTDEHFEECYTDVLNAYLLNEVGRLINNASVELYESVSYTDTLENLDRSTIAMD